MQAEPLALDHAAIDTQEEDANGQPEEQPARDETEGRDAPRFRVAAHLIAAWRLLTRRLRVSPRPPPRRAGPIRSASTSSFGAVRAVRVRPDPRRVGPHGVTFCTDLAGPRRPRLAVANRLCSGSPDVGRRSRALRPRTQQTPPRPVRSKHLSAQVPSHLLALLGQRSCGRPECVCETGTVLNARVEPLPRCDGEWGWADSRERAELECMGPDPALRAGGRDPHRLCGRAQTRTRRRCAHLPRELRLRILARLGVVLSRPRTGNPSASLSHRSRERRRHGPPSLGRARRRWRAAARAPEDAVLSDYAGRQSSFR